jgi:RHS repeat-associated protein
LTAPGYSYDANGNLLSDPTNDYQYDWENMMIASGPSGGTANATYTYGPDGQRIQQTTSAGVINYTVDAQSGFGDVVEERDQDGGLQARYNYGDDLVRMDRGTGIYYYLYDGGGNTRQLVNGSGITTDTYAYDAFGDLIARTGSTTNPYLFNGQEQDSATGLYYLRARYMDPSRDEFLSQDTFPGHDEDPISLHKYLYASDDAVDRCDPGGHDDSMMEVVVTTAIQQGLISLAIGAPFRVLQYVQAIRAGIDIGQATESLLLGMGEDFGIGAAFGAAGKLLEYAMPLLKLRQVGAAMIRAADSVWANSNWFQRGRQFEEMILGRLPTLISVSNFPVIDDWINGIATSIKSLDLTAASYDGNIANLTSRLGNYAKKLSMFNGAVRGGITVSGNQIQQRVLLVALERGAATGPQMEALLQFEKNIGQYIADLRAANPTKTFYDIKVVYQWIK